MLKRPAELEKLYTFAKTTTVPAEFSGAVDKLWPKVKSEISYPGYSGKPFELEMADRLFRSTHHFRFPLQATYAIFYGKSVANARALMEISENLSPDFSASSNGSLNHFDGYKLKEAIYTSWGQALYCTRAVTPFNISQALNLGFLRSIPVVIDYAKTTLGLLPKPEHLIEAQQFIEHYYSDSRHRRDLFFL